PGRNPRRTCSRVVCLQGVGPVPLRSAWCEPTHDGLHGQAKERSFRVAAVGAEALCRGCPLASWSGPCGALDKSRTSRTWRSSRVLGRADEDGGRIWRYVRTNGVGVAADAIEREGQG